MKRIDTKQEMIEFVEKNKNIFESHLSNFDTEDIDLNFELGVDDDLNIVSTVSGDMVTKKYVDIDSAESITSKRKVITAYYKVYSAKDEWKILCFFKRSVTL